MGINILEIVEDVIPELNRQYYINEIACDLAGRVAEQMIGSENNAGAAADLKQASRVAEKMVTELGLSSGKVYSNRSYWDDSMGNTEKVTKEIDAEINKAIKEATKLAEKLLTENEDILHALAEALLQNHIMMAEELDEVWQKTVNARKNSNVNTSGKIKHSKKKTKNVAQKIRKAIRKRKAQKVHYSKKP
jgi:ATP-dependent Zn protease